MKIVMVLYIGFLLSGLLLGWGLCKEFDAPAVITRTESITVRLPPEIVTEVVYVDNPIARYTEEELAQASSFIEYCIAAHKYYARRFWVCNRTSGTWERNRELVGKYEFLLELIRR